MLMRYASEFTVEGTKYNCKLKLNVKEEQYLLWINEALVTELPPAPPIKKENIPPVC